MPAIEIRALARARGALASGLLLAMLCACSTIETAADRTRDFTRSHPVATAIAVGTVAAAAYAAADHRRGADPVMFRRPIEH